MTRRTICRRLLGDLNTDLSRLEERIRQVTKERSKRLPIERRWHADYDNPGIGALGATASLAAIGNG